MWCLDESACKFCACYTVLYAGMLDCSDLAQHGIDSSGVYTLLSNDATHPLSSKAVYCDMDTELGG